MPNWCYNSLTIFSDSQDLSSLQDYMNKSIVPSERNIREMTLSFSALVPVPSGTIIDLNEAWGTKWEPDDADIHYIDKDNRLVVTFTTAWSPPIPYLLKVSQQYPTLCFELFYEEAGCDLLGELTIVDGDIVEEIDVHDLEPEDSVRYRVSENGQELWMAIQIVYNLDEDDEEDLVEIERLVEHFEEMGIT